MNIAELIANCMKSASSLGTSVLLFKAKIEAAWKSVTGTVELAWSCVKSAGEKLESWWKSAKTSVESAWASIWGGFDSKIGQDEINQLIELASVNEDSRVTCRRVGVNIGLLYVDKSVYGTDASCPGCDSDATNMNRLLSRLGFSTRLFLNMDATWENIKGHLEKLSMELEEGDLLVLTAAGHGGQVSDKNGDESDKYDETWLLYDKEVPDDEILKIVRKFKPGVRMVFINDQCHSEGNFRSLVRGIQRGLSFGHWGRRDAVPLTEPRCERQHTVEEPALIQFAGCRENSYSYGDSNGGEWTSALIKTFKDGMTWREWFDQASRIPKRQKPQWVEFGPVDDGFRNGKAMQ